MASETTHTDGIPVTVIIPSFNMGKFIGQSITSVLTGEFEDVEVLVVDDGSTDHTRVVVDTFINPQSKKHDARVRYIYKKNGGKPSALNEGLKHAKGSFITVLDADDELTPDSLKVRFDRIRELQSRPEIVIGGFEVFDKDQTLGRRNQPTITDPKMLKERFYMSFKTPFHFNACLMTRELVDRVGPFDTELNRCQDVDYAMRCLHHTNAVSFADAIVYRYRKHRSSIKERLRFRWKTALHRPRVLWKNFTGPKRVAMVLYGIGLDAAKMAYELAGNYKN